MEQSDAEINRGSQHVEPRPGESSRHDAYLSCWDAGGAQIALTSALVPILHRLLRLGVLAGHFLGLMLLAGGMVFSLYEGEVRLTWMQDARRTSAEGERRGAQALKVESASGSHDAHPEDQSCICRMFTPD